MQSSGGCGGSRAAAAAKTPKGAAGKDAINGAAHVGSAHAHHGAHGAADSAKHDGDAKHAHTFHKNDSAWKKIAGRASDSPQARKAFDLFNSLRAKYPTEAALQAAGFKLDKGSSNHYNFKGKESFEIDGVKLAHLVVQDGKVTQAQFDSSVLKEGDPPPNWAGVQWHFHDHGKASWMFHVSADQDIDQAFIEEKSH